jgi:hypothetical protein
MGIPVTGQNLSWYIKPRMRITTTDAFSDPPKNVCKIIVKAYNGDIIREEIINTARFRHDNGNTYNGRYLEELWQLSLDIPADDLHRGAPWWSGGGGLANCQVDYQILWYGEVDLWIDYVKVMDNVANEYYGADSLIIRNYLKRLQ